MALRDVTPGSCYQPLRFEPETDSIDWQSATGRQRAARSSTDRILESFETTIALQTDETLPNARRGFFLVYLKSFNEWFEGHQFKPMKEGAELASAEQAIGYHNPGDGDYRRKVLTGLLAEILPE